MKNTVSQWIESFKNWLNPRNVEENQIVEDEFYRESRTVKRRHRKLMVRRYATLASGLIIILLIIGGIFWGVHKVTYSNKANTLDQEINQLYTDNRHADLKDSVTQNKLNRIKTDINGLKQRKQTKQLGNEQVIAQNAYRIQTSYNHFFNKQTRIGLKVTTKQVDQQLQALNSKKVPAAFKTNYTKRLKSVRKIVVKANKLSERYQAIMDARNAGSSVSVETVQALIQDMHKNQKSQKTVDQQTKLISLKTALTNESQQAAQVAAQQAEQQAAQEAAAQQEAEAESSAAAASSSLAAQQAATSSSSTTQDTTSQNQNADATTGTGTDSTTTTDNGNNTGYSAYDATISNGTASTSTSY